MTTTDTTDTTEDLYVTDTETALAHYRGLIFLAFNRRIDRTSRGSAKQLDEENRNQWANASSHKSRIGEEEREERHADALARFALLWEEKPRTQDEEAKAVYATATLAARWHRSTFGSTRPQGYRDAMDNCISIGAADAQEAYQQCESDRNLADVDTQDWLDNMEPAKRMHARLSIAGHSVEEIAEMCQTSIGTEGRVRSQLRSELMADAILAKLDVEKRGRRRNADLESLLGAKVAK